MTESDRLREACGKLWVSFGSVVRCPRRAVWKQTTLAGGVEVIERRCRRHRLRKVIAEERLR